MGKDIYVGERRKEIIFQDIFNNIQNGDRVIMSETKSFHTLTDGLTVPEDGELEIVGRAGEDVIVSAGMTVYGQLILRNLTLDLSLTDANAGERIYVDRGNLILENVKIIGSARTASPVMVNSGKIILNSSTVINKAEQSYAVELKNASTGSVENCNVDGLVVIGSKVEVYDSNVYKGVFVKEQSEFVGGNTNFDFADAVDPRNIYCTDSALTLKQSSVTGDKVDNPIRAFRSELYLSEMSMMNVRDNGFALELNEGSIANISICKIRGIFAKASTVQIDGDVTVLNFLELYDKSRLTGADIRVNIAPPNYSMQVTEGSSVDLEKLNSRFSPIIKVDNSAFKVAGRYVERGIINIDAIGNTAIEGDNIEIRELDKAEKQQSAEETNSNTVDESSDALEKLNEMIGLSEVKASVRKFINLTKVNKQKKERGLPARQSSLHSVYLGNPGTGKTTVARLVGQVLYQEGVLKSNKFVEVSRQNLVSGFIGKTSEITLEKLKEAHGGVFFVDEAYTLNSGGGSTNYGQEALDTILKYMEDNRDSIMIIFAGYTKEMYDFFNMNPGLKSRIPHYFNFEDYTQEELSEIGIKELKKEQYQFDEAKYMKELKKNYKRGSDTSNARFVRNFNEALILEQSNRVAEAQLSESEDFLKIIEEDWNNALGVNEDESSNSLASIRRELDNLTGLESVKQFINKLIKEAQANKMFEERGMDIGSSSYHMVFTGPPGTGKTTIARLIAKFFKQLDILPDDKLIEVDRSDLVGSYIGHTEKNTKNAIDRAMGGVLFIDEAYQLSIENSDNDFGKQAIETLITELENNRDKFIVIFAGYSEDMERFMNANEGLKSRVPYTIEFPAYKAEDVVEIVLNMLRGQWRFNEDFLRMTVMNAYEQLPEADKSNGRWARNFTQKLLMQHKNYIVNEDVEPDNFDFITDKVIFGMGEE